MGTISITLGALFDIGLLKAVIWDFDGILGDTEGLQMEKWNILLRPYGIVISLAEYIAQYCGKSSATEIPVLLKQKYGDKIPLTEQELGQRAAEILQQLFETHPIEFMPGARSAIRFCQTKGLEMAICSAKDPDELEMKLRNSGISKCFPRKLRSTQSQAGGVAKPHPAMYAFAVKQLGLFPYECIAFEDTAAGVNSASAAGVVIVALPNMYSEGQDFSNAHFVVRGGWPGFFTALKKDETLLTVVRF